MERSEEKITYFVDEETLTKEELAKLLEAQKGGEQNHEDTGV